ncbi:hypothetical protein [Marinitenerispora sediminis]|uniref:Zinc-finger domain-containing protein n=1 Tax=Marinitenerispora sediminis TaxID=1931232 RepID=A0A368T9N9_9ACTN|nr:hypothetical protein [Marinitenerispora sediminis]RCV52817.1 hypothetical protein DEF28_12095 [Marinitenerispora sediminis]RCV59923.1 hypothetical protein DEF23_06075 [Marinitenerispora sediminis]RCV61339.1 hypothetical protein DEF24_04610 [Marinitenerispora sediminis]
MSHLDEERIQAAARARRAGGRAADEEHLAACAACRERVAALRAVAAAAAAVDAAETEAGTLTVPSFDALVLPGLRGAPAAAPLPPAPRAAWRLTLELVARQARLVPGALWPLTALGFAAVLLLAWRAGPVVGSLVLGPGVTLLVTLGALAVCEPRRDPRREVLAAIPIPPVAVWLARLAFVLGIDLVAATAASLLLGALDRAAGPLPLVGAWLGPALLSAGLAVFGSVWRSPALGATLALTAWAAGTVAALGGLADGVGHGLAAVWATNPATLALACALFAAAAWLVSRPARTLPEGPL